MSFKCADRFFDFHRQSYHLQIVNFIPSFPVIASFVCFCEKVPYSWFLKELVWYFTVKNTFTKVFDRYTLLLRKLHLLLFLTCFYHYLMMNFTAKWFFCLLNYHVISSYPVLINNTCVLKKHLRLSYCIIIFIFSWVWLVSIIFRVFV